MHPESFVSNFWGASRYVYDLYVLFECVFECVGSI